MKHHLVIIYDGIENSVFEGQVLAPLVQKLKMHPHDRGLIISFEKKTPSHKALAAITAHPTLDYHLLYKIPFLGSLSLYYAVHQLKQIMHHYTITSITARGPLAAWIISHVQSLTIPCIVQARGLAAQEYAYTHAHMQSWFMRQLHRFRMYQYESIERYVYGTYARQSSCTIHAVSTPLQEYLITTFGAPPDKIIIEHADIPRTFDPAIIRQWRTTYRNQLHISEDSYVYVYNGSAKSWQCPHETISYFVEQYACNSHAFLLILTQDQQPFIDLCVRHAIPSSAYHIMHVRHDMIYQYLAIADAGIIFRAAHIINWISRPTKILEYQAVGLSIIHNNTVAMLVDHIV